MHPNDLRELLKARPFKPVRVGLSDGRSLLIRHPDQAVVSNRWLMAGVTKIGVSAPLVTPDSSEEIARDGFWADLLHIVSVEPAEEAA